MYLNTSLLAITTRVFPVARPLLALVLEIALATILPLVAPPSRLGIPSINHTTTSVTSHGVR